MKFTAKNEDGMELRFVQLALDKYTVSDGEGFDMTVTCPSRGFHEYKKHLQRKHAKLPTGTVWVFHDPFGRSRRTVAQGWTPGEKDIAGWHAIDLRKHWLAMRLWDLIEKYHCSVKVNQQGTGFVITSVGASPSLSSLVLLSDPDLAKRLEGEDE